MHVTLLKYENTTILSFNNGLTLQYYHLIMGNCQLSEGTLVIYEVVLHIKEKRLRKSYIRVQSSTINRYFYFIGCYYFCIFG